MRNGGWRRKFAQRWGRDTAAIKELTRRMDEYDKEIKSGKSL